MTPETTIGRSRFVVGQPLPVVLKRNDLAGIFNVSMVTGWRMEREGKFRLFELLPRVGRARYSGKKVQQWLDGEGEAPRYFASARRRA